MWIPTLDIVERNAKLLDRRWKLAEHVRGHGLMGGALAARQLMIPRQFPRIRGGESYLPLGVSGDPVAHGDMRMAATGP
jgi:hypothetical protein